MDLSVLLTCVQERDMITVSRNLIFRLQCLTKSKETMFHLGERKSEICTAAAGGHSLKSFDR